MAPMPFVSAPPHPKPCRTPWACPRRCARPAAAALAVAAIVAAGAAANAETLTVVSWGGPYADAQRTAFIDAFEAETGIEVKMDEFGGGLARVRAQARTQDVYWDVVDLEFADVVLGCEEGLLHRFDADEFPAPDGTLARDDYYSDAYSECGVAGVIYSTVIAYNAQAYPKTPPTSVADFFDVKRFPGKRGMRRTPLANLELALMADGVKNVYQALDTEAGRAKAFAKLDVVKPHVLWWDVAAQAVQMLASGEVAMATTFNGRVFHEAVIEKQPIEIIWDGEVLDSSQFAIVAGTPRLAAAKRFAEFVSRPESMAALARQMPFNPARRSANVLVTGDSAIGIDMQRYLPASEEHLRQGLWYDWPWWHDNLDELTERFTAWDLD